MTSTTTAPTTSATDSGATTTGTESASGSAPAPAVTTPAGATSGGATAPAGRDQATSGLPTCQASGMSIRVEAAAGGGAAGSQVLDLRATNTGSAPCATQGYPGVSLVAPGTGAQLGAAADRTAGESGASGPLLRLEPGASAISHVKVGRADLYGAECVATPAAGFRVYLPGTTAAAFAPYQIGACTPASFHQLQVQPFTR